jgi:hypothetical protein
MEFAMLDHSTLVAHIHYDPDTGAFTRKIASARRVKVGDVCGAISGGGYRYIRLCGKAYKANRLAWFYVHGEWPSGLVDHINGIKDDDRICNLRVCTNAENCQNRTRAKGAYMVEGGKYTSLITVNGKRHYLGRFSSESEARSAYLEAKRTFCPTQNMENIS